jgi:hypothetical protein
MKKVIKDPRGRKSLPDSEKKKVVSIMVKGRLVDEVKSILIQIEKEYSNK